ncbi:MAG: bifunctional hydroxymethylpyrimidine kinase/phosphomethylpyrimidine kinase [Acidiphilium sp. 37-64-53]|uniref:bifunctional hydroxymethylpyrimidine kinase/phosphomethylpyrimidine kinase n=1 Tax=Acidiphilium TaxID=522 RepID=UPI000BD0E8EF|nr:MULTISPECIES: bifunctional hydroxymethylpyrimidine kinase/phosphomethylpyrimidine kinase [Acidiphilium]OYW02600.1 MAG: bifunctional hydroxymethylpyrimidine kinase/phosphomethylpyrimidine kinase [Acidiphilium sp. 37-64-53]OZB29888.1 MAG: bifunctional hydroxymethylpyrimidine kinase/phosphomethylpyrimidine kinase [Acidiphilium sp. 34-64-41]HQT84016.1 bifunctional hydroxymethylpyrimidine kinase/phosphomethylpyrimidine kinase [Acidiphilium rubrum]
MNPPRILAIGGSDSGGGAGIEADIKTITALGGYAMTAITAVTAQDTVAIQAITPIPPAMVGRAIAMVLADIGVDAIKIGMLGSAAMVETIAAALAPLPRSLPIVLDTILAATSGTDLLDPDAAEILLRDLMPLATLITPNRHEAAKLSGHPIDTPADAIAAARLLCDRGARAVLLKGGHFDASVLIDRLITPDDVQSFPQPRIDTSHTHGTGCTLASAIALGLAEGLDLPAAIIRAQAFLQAALRAAPGFGAGHGPMGHAAAAPGRPLA